MAPTIDLSEDQEHRAHRLLLHASEDPESYPEILQQILTEIIKPLFASSTSHSSSKTNEKITTTGRKRLIPLPSLPGNFNDTYDSLVDDPHSIIKRQPWKNGWAVPLIHDILAKHYLGIASISQGHPSTKKPISLKTTIESHFYLFVPPILNIIDDADLAYRARGCDCLNALCRLLSSASSDIMSRSGLGEVFITTLQANLSWLPPLTEEEEAMRLIASLYPVYLATVHVGFPSSNPANITTSRETKISAVRSTKTHQIRSNHLTYLLRHGILHGLSHLSSTGLTQPTNTTSTALTTFLITQLSPLIKSLGPNATRRHTQYLFPLLRSIISDPFAINAPPSANPNPHRKHEQSTSQRPGSNMVTATIEALQTLIDTLCLPPPSSQPTSPPPDLQKWYPECLRGTVACYLNVLDERESLLTTSARKTDSPRRESASSHLDEIEAGLKQVVESLVRNVVIDGPDLDGDTRKDDMKTQPPEHSKKEMGGWRHVISRLTAADERLAALFKGRGLDDQSDAGTDHDDVAGTTEPNRGEGVGGVVAPVTTTPSTNGTESVSKPRIEVLG